MYKILIADDHPIFRKGLKEVLQNNYPDAEIIEAENGYEVLKEGKPIETDLYILDIEMPEVDGISLCKKIKAQFPQAPVIMLTMYRDEAMISAALKAGANAYLLKDFSAEEIRNCITEVLQGRTYFSRVLALNINANNPEDIETQELLSNLTKTEINVLSLVCRNLSSKEIADRLFVTEKSIENYRSRICKKLNLAPGHNILIKWALENKERIIIGIGHMKRMGKL